MPLCRLLSFFPMGLLHIFSDAKYIYYVVLGWNTTSTAFLTSLKIILLELGFGPVNKHVADVAQKHVADIAQKREGLLYLTYMAE